MPELPEVERAAKLIRDVAKGRVIERVDTNEDTIVYTDGISHAQFAKEIEGRKVLDVKRHGKIFYIVLDGEGRMPVLHFGMTGMIQIQGQEPTWYQQRPNDVVDEWPPRFTKFILHFPATEGHKETQIAFRDARRLARIRLCASPAEEPPISALGFDPILSMPSLETFTASVQKRNCPIKALLLDQAFSAGVGNWVADEILFQSQIHPEQRANALTDTEISTMYDKMVYVCKTAVDVDADSAKFPENWLFRHRWGKGKKEHPIPLTLADGSKAKIKWIKSGGRTSAVVEQVQKPPGALAKKGASKRKKKVVSEDEDEDEGSSDLTELSDEEPTPAPPKRGRAAAKSKTKDDPEPSSKKAKVSKAPRKAKKATQP